MEKSIEEISPKPLTKAKLWEMTSIIINALKTSRRLSSNPEPDWKELEGEWFDWLEEELIQENEEINGNNEQL